MIAFIKPISTKTSPGELYYLQIRTLTSMTMAADLRLSNIALKNCFSDGVRSKATVGVKPLQQQEELLWRTVATCKEELGKPGKTKFLIIKRRKLCERKKSRLVWMLLQKQRQCDSSFYLSAYLDQSYLHIWSNGGQGVVMKLFIIHLFIYLFAYLYGCMHGGRVHMYTH